MSPKITCVIAVGRGLLERAGERRVVGLPRAAAGDAGAGRAVRPAPSRTSGRRPCDRLRPASSSNIVIIATTSYARARAVQRRAAVLAAAPRDRARGGRAQWPPTRTVMPMRTARGSAGYPATASNVASNAFSTVEVRAQARVNLVRPAEVELLVRRIHILVRQQHRVAEELVGQERAVVALADEVAGQRRPAPSASRRTTTRLPEFAGRRNGRSPTSGEYCPIGMPGNAGLTAGLSAPLLNDSVTVGVEVRVRAEDSDRGRPPPRPTVSTPLDLFDCEFT